MSMLPTSHCSAVTPLLCSTPPTSVGTTFTNNVLKPQIPLNVRSAELTVCQTFPVHRETATAKEAS